MQNSLFDPAYQQDSVPEFIRSLMEQGAALSVSISGGKDSDAMLRFLAKLYQANGWKGGLSALFCELGRIEWLGVIEHIQKLTRDLSVPLVRLLPKRSMIKEWQHRYETIISKQESKPFWSSAAARYCTKHERHSQLISCCVVMTLSFAPSAYERKNRRLELRSHATR